MDHLNFTSRHDYAKNMMQLQKGVQSVRQEPHYAALRRFVRKGSVIFDVGANIGWWTLAFTENEPCLDLHLFEPAPPSFGALSKNARRYFPKAKLNNLAVGEKEECLKFYHYKDHSAFSGLFRRRNEEANGAIERPEIYHVNCVTLDDYCLQQGIFHIDILKIDVDGAEVAVLSGASRLLTAGSVDVLQFEYGGTFADSGCTLRSAYDFLTFRDYALYYFSTEGLTPMLRWNERLENYQFANYIAIHRRLVGWFEGRKPTMIDLGTALAREGIKPRGVLHIGAYDGKELIKYRELGASPIVFIEANPKLASNLRKNMAYEPDVIVAEYAITDGSAETVTLHVTNMDQSSSVLPLKEHKNIYPTIVEEYTVDVKAITVDALLSKLKLDASEFNLMNIDIQGAELSALRGATETLNHIAAINTEINFRELYSGCALSHEIDAFLYNFGFLREDSVCPYDPSWGDAFFAKKAVISMSTLGRNGRFANCIFQYAFIKHYANKHGLTVEVPPWVGNMLFGVNDPSPNRAYPRVSQTSNDLTEDSIANADPPLKNVDIYGYFQYPTLYAHPRDKMSFRKMFSPVPRIKARLLETFSRVMAGKQTLVAAHLRRGDYGCAYFFVAPSRWYLDWLEQIWNDLPDPVLYIASDEPDKVLKDFAAYNPISRADLGNLDCVDTLCPCYPDFYMLTKADRLAISNSSFSFAAAMLNQTATQFVRPRLGLKKLISFEPFEGPTLFCDEVIEEKGPSGFSVGR